MCTCIRHSVWVTVKGRLEEKSVRGSLGDKSVRGRLTIMP